MTDRDSFEASLDANPADAATRLMYADWLEENGLRASAHAQRWMCFWRLFPTKQKARETGRTRRQREAVERFEEWQFPMPETQAEETPAQHRNRHQAWRIAAPNGVWDRATVVWGNKTRREIESRIEKALSECVNAAAALSHDAMLTDEAQL